MSCDSLDVNKYGGYVFYYIFNKGKLILIGRAYIARDCYLLLPGLVCKGKIKNKMFKKNVKGMQQILRREFWLYTHWKKNAFML